MLNRDCPRPGEVYQLPTGGPRDDNVLVEATMPGAIDYDRGLVKVDFQFWPFFQALDVDHILTCVEVGPPVHAVCNQLTGVQVALSHSGRIVFCSKYPSMLNIAVSSLKYIVELRGWNGIALPMMHAVRHREPGTDGMLILYSET